LERADEYLLAHPELGLSLYDLHADGSGICYSSRLRPILHMRPNMRAWVSGGLRHFAADLYLLDWLERKGFGYDVLTDEDLHHAGKDLLTPYNVVLTGTHPEYWTAPMLAGLEEYLGGGGRLMYLGGNGFYWVTSVDPERPHVVEVRRGVAGTRAWQSAPGECYHSTTGELGGLWRYRGKAPQTLVGVGFTAEGWGRATGYRRQAGSFDERAAFIFAGIGADEIIGDFGLMLNGAAGDELDRVDEALGTPPHTLVLASSTGHSDYYQFVVEDLLETTPGQGGTRNPNVRSDMVFFEMPNGGAVFAVGSICWCGSLPYNNFDNNVSRITENVLRRFMARA
jgi:N,N-dimethylformamidase